MREQQIAEDLDAKERSRRRKLAIRALRDEEKRTVEERLKLRQVCMYVCMYVCMLELRSV